MTLFCYLAEKNTPQHELEMSCRTLFLPQKEFSFENYPYGNQLIYLGGYAKEDPYIEGQRRLLFRGLLHNSKKLSTTYFNGDHLTDQEIVMGLYDQLGFLQTLTLLEGSFALILWDGAKLYFARDPYGIEPLFLGLIQGRFMGVASYAKALHNLCDQLGVFPPGTFLLFENDQTRLVRYFQPTNIAQKKSRSWKKKLTQQIVRGVKRHYQNKKFKTILLLSFEEGHSFLTQLLAQTKVAKHVETLFLKEKKEEKEEKKEKEKNVFEIDFSLLLNLLPRLILALESYEIRTIREAFPLFTFLEQYENNSTLLISTLGFRETLMKQSLSLLHQYSLLTLERCCRHFGMEFYCPFLTPKIRLLLRKLPSKKKKKLLEQHPKTKMEYSQNPGNLFKTLPRPNKEYSYHDPPKTKEALKYRREFEKIFPKRGGLIKKTRSFDPTW